MQMFHQNQYLLFECNLTPQNEPRSLSYYHFHHTCFYKSIWFLWCWLSWILELTLILYFFWIEQVLLAWHLSNIHQLRLFLTFLDSILEMKHMLTTTSLDPVMISLFRFSITFSILWYLWILVDNPLFVWTSTSPSSESSYLGVWIMLIPLSSTWGATLFSWPFTSSSSLTSSCCESSIT